MAKTINFSSYFCCKYRFMSIFSFKCINMVIIHQKISENIYFEDELFQKIYFKVCKKTMGGLI